MFGNKLREARINKGMTLDEVADAYNKKYDGKLNKSTLSPFARLAVAGKESKPLVVIGWPRCPQPLWEQERWVSLALHGQRSGWTEALPCLWPEN